MNKIKAVKYLSGFLGISMTILGLLKFIDPFKSWYSTQVLNSELPFPFYAMGIAGELIVGITLIFMLYRFDQLKSTVTSMIIQMAGLAIIGMMVIAVYVHIHPAVSADVLPLKIKPPFIPVFFAILAIFNVYLIRTVKSKELS